MYFKYTKRITIVCAAVLATACANPFGFDAKTSDPLTGKAYSNGRLQGGSSHYQYAYNPYTQNPYLIQVAHQTVHQPVQMPYTHVNSNSPSTIYQQMPMHSTSSRSRVNLNYEALSMLEDPLALDIRGTTVLLNGRLDAPLTYSAYNQDENGASIIGNHQLSVERQLLNRLTVGAVYAGRAYDSGSDAVIYEDQVAGFVGGVWGTLYAGNVSNQVFEDTRRLRGATHLNLAGDGALGGLSDISAGYKGRYGPIIVSSLIDADSHYDLGVTFQRPIGNKDYRVALRHNNGRLLADDGLTQIDTKSVSSVAEYVFGSTRYDIGAGMERLSDISNTANRWYTSAGLSTKQGAWGFSAEGHYGQVDNEQELSALIGLRRDIARGLAVTAAIDYEDRQVDIGGVNYTDVKDTRAILGLSYGF